MAKQKQKERLDHENQLGVSVTPSMRQALETECKVGGEQIPLAQLVRQLLREALEARKAQRSMQHAETVHA